MALKTMLEATQDVVSGNEVVHAAGTLYASMDEVPEGVPVRSVVAEVPDDAPPAPPAPPEPPPAPKGGAKK